MQYNYLHAVAADQSIGLDIITTIIHFYANYTLPFDSTPESVGQVRWMTSNNVCVRVFLIKPYTFIQPNLFI
jgi:hypothetical protein